MATVESKARPIDLETYRAIEKLKTKLGGIHQKSKEWVHCGKWLKSGVITYLDPECKEHTYETVERTTRKEGSLVDGVDAVCLSAAENGSKKICLVVIYRAPVNSLCIEFPSGLIEHGERLEDAAARELAEETGHCAVFKSAGPVIHCDPWKSNESTVVCVGELKESRKPLELDDDEFLEPLELPLKNLKDQLEYLQREHDFVIEAKLYYFALGLQLNRQQSM